MLVDPIDWPNLWILILAFVIAFLLAFSVGANDVSNSFGTSVGSRVLTVTQACILATFFEVAGSTLLGYKVCDTFRKSVYDVNLYKDDYKELMIGALSCLIGSATWNMIATALKMPISGTHSIVGATIGFTIVLKGWASVEWPRILRIVASWFASPLLSGAISSLIYLLISKTVIRKIDPLKNGLKALPLFYGATVFINVASVLLSGSEVLGLQDMEWYLGLFYSLVIAAGVICVIALVIVPKMKTKILDEVITATTKKANGYGRSNNSKKPRPPHRVATTSLTTQKKPPPIIGGQATAVAGEGKQVVGFDNVAFKPDTQPGGDATSPTSIHQEITLDPSRLALEGKTGPKGSRPPIAPKPAHLLRRQEAQDEHQMEDIDLSSPPQASVNPIGNPAGTANCPSGFSKNSSPNTDIESCSVPTSTPAVSAAGGGGGGHHPKSSRPGMIRGERLEVFRLFSSLQILTACFASFAHGTNDVSNAVAPLIPIWNIFTTGQENIETPTQVFILAFGGIGICTGLWAWGRAVMSTVGDGLTQLTPSKGFAIELGAAISVLTATSIGMPISTTHCKVGSVVIVGLVSAKFCSRDNLLDMNEEEQAQESNKKAVDWKLFGNIAITWIITVPLAAVASAIVTLIFKWLIPRATITQG